MRDTGLSHSVAGPVPGPIKCGVLLASVAWSTRELQSYQLLATLAKYLDLHKCEGGAREMVAHTGEDKARGHRSVCSRVE